MVFQAAVSLPLFADIYISWKCTEWFDFNTYFQGHHIIDTDSGKCLEGQTSYDITLKPCEPDNKRQRWRFRTYNPSYFQLINSESVPGIDSSLLDKFSKYIHLAQKKRLKQHSRERRELDDRNPRINNVQSLQGSNFVEKVLKKWIKNLKFSEFPRFFYCVKLRPHWNALELWRWAELWAIYSTL